MREDWELKLIGSGRLCRARTFMRSVVKEDETVGLLLFDEPSASLDPIAEHGQHIFALHPVC